jgi:hypothetical protein
MVEARRKGFWIGFGLGYGSLGINVDGFGSSERDGDVSGYLRLGGTVNENLLIGMESNTWLDYSNGDFVSVGLASITMYGYPGGGDFFLKAGPGIASTGVYFDGEYDDEYGFGAIIGIGYDGHISEKTSITPAVSYYKGWYDGFSTDVLQIGLGLTFH